MSSPPTLPALGARPLVSVLIVNYNYEQYLAAAIESVLAQTYQNFEIVICDDGSKDDSRAVITRYAAEEPRIRPIFKQNGGMGAALNDAFAASTGAIIAMLDADDLFLPHKLDAVIAALRGGGRVGIVFHPLTMVDVNGEAIGRMPQFGNFEQGELREGILRAGGHVAGAPNSAIAMRRECALRAFPIPAADFRSEADAYLRVAGALFYAVAALDEPLSAYRVHSSNLTASRAVDLKWSERTVAAASRISHAAKAIADGEGWPMAPLEENPGYCETALINAYLRNASRDELIARIRQLHTALRNVTAGERGKLWLKARLLSSAVLLPQPLGRRIIEQIYLPSALKRAAGWFRARAQR